MEMSDAATTLTEGQPHVVTVKRNDPQGPGKPCAFFLDCTCGWGADYVSTSKHNAMRYALEHSKEAVA